MTNDVPACEVCGSTENIGVSIHGIIEYHGGTDFIQKRPIGPLHYTCPKHPREPERLATGMPDTLEAVEQRDKLDMTYARLIEMETDIHRKKILEWLRKDLQGLKK